ncbi:hypothetical protein NDU88_005237 [Pleurodeles waltl]|uniref:Uncharacterized protein n=1 Tax=Pleurodeles waltl TaxID=8319 RepID=A0AAV7MBI8_PLEWA|nr:hypothetical protein NDU88_005237 [Pleurodeles waltl]
MCKTCVHQARDLALVTRTTTVYCAERETRWVFTSQQSMRDKVAAFSKPDKNCGFPQGSASTVGGVPYLRVSPDCPHDSYPVVAPAVLTPALVSVASLAQPEVGTLLCAQRHVCITAWFLTQSPHSGLRRQWVYLVDSTAPGVTPASVACTPRACCSLSLHRGIARS